MAKNSKLSPDLIKSFFKESNIRTEGNLQPRRYYLIVCEGEKTEPNYFNSIKNYLPKYMVNRVDIDGQGKNTLSLVEAVKKLVIKRKESGEPHYYHIWVVFDKDSFDDDDFDNAINKIESMSSETEKWHSAWSNQAFELWYILHFKDETGGALERTSYQKLIQEDMKTFLGIDRKYKKNAEDMFKNLRRLTPSAIVRAGNALKVQGEKPFHEMNPATNVHNLVRDLANYLPDDFFIKDE